MQAQTMAVRSRLKLLIAERNIERIKTGQSELTIRRIAEEAGVPPSVISGLTAGRAKQVAFKTLDSLCRYFKVEPGDILEYMPDENR
jgi:putative transcriptional regulator